MNDISDDAAETPPGTGVVLRAQNGDVIRYDATGLVLRLSDKVVADLALRLDLSADTPAPAPAPAPDLRLPPDIDAWDLRADGDWLRFTARLPGAQGVRAMRRHVDGGDIIADTVGPVLGLLGLGGARAALASPRAPDFGPHIVAPADDIGAVGHAGIEPAQRLDRFEHLREVTHEALVAETLLHQALADFTPLPLIMARAETDGSATASDLSCGQAVENLLVAAECLHDGAALMGKRARVLAVCLDFALEDLSPTARAYHSGMLAVMDAVSDGLWARGFDRPLFVARFETGLPDLAPQAALEGQWELTWSHGDHLFIHSAPAYMFALDAYDRPTDAARLQQAEMTASALMDPQNWSCPVLHLAELTGRDLRVTARAQSPLILDQNDPFDAGLHYGFALTGCENGAVIDSVNIAEDDPQALCISLSKKPEGTDLKLAYAASGPRTGALRDTWQRDSRTGASLHRWALPAHLPVTGGRSGD